MKVVKILIALLVVIGISYWAYDSTKLMTYNGEQFQFTVGQGNTATIIHEADAPILVDMTARSTFNVVSSNTDLSGSSAREGSGRDLVHRYQTEVPAGTVDFRVSRGSNITIAVEADTAVEAVMTPLSSEDARNTYIVAVIVILAALFYISRTFQHRWIKVIIQKVGKNDRMMPTQPSPVDASS